MANSWDWTIGIDPDVIDLNTMYKAYHLDRDCFNSSICKRNCTQKPKCIFAVGEKKWLREDTINISDDLKDLSLCKKNDTNYSGLRNLGATCYVNSLLQVWFHNTFLRKAIYNWNPNLDIKEISFDSNVPFNPRSPIGQLQLVFARLQFGYNKFVDPSPFIRSLNLDVSQQQDAQEFCKLFLDFLEDDLSSQEDATIRNVVQNEFAGEYCYVTTCLKCGFESSTKSKFYELTLNIENSSSEKKGNRKVEDCLSQFFEKELMEGLNSYSCPVCQIKQSATRGIVLTKLPPTLNLQLLRFVYDRSQNVRKKLNCSIGFPEVLDMAPYFPNSNNGKPIIYHLRAVLQHFGKSAHSGHYVAQIKDVKKNIWYKFNDETVRQLDIKNFRKALDNLDINNDDEVCIIEPKVTKEVLRVKEGDRLSSENAYMLVYQLGERETYDPVNWQEVLPFHLSQVIAEERAKFDKWTCDVKELQQLMIERFNSKKQYVQQFYHLHKLLDESKSDLEFICKDWLVSWFKCEPGQESPVIDNSSLLCSHGKLALDITSTFKCTSKKAAMLLYDKFRVNPRLTQEQLCFNCVGERIRCTNLKHQVSLDHKKITDLIKSKPTCDRYYWIGNESFRLWKKVALKEDGFRDFVFNTDLVCEHGGLSNDPNCRRLVPQTVWLIFVQYFKYARSFEESHELCPVCQVAKMEDQNRKDIAVARAASEKEKLKDLFESRKRPQVDELPDGTEVYALNIKFTKKWRSFLENPAKGNPPCEIRNCSLLCEHQRVLFPPDARANISGLEYVLLYKEEWQEITSLYRADQEICVQKASQGEKVVLITRPPHCGGCYARFISEERAKQLDYKNCIIYVRKVHQELPDSELLGSGSDGGVDEKNINDTAHEREETPKKKFCTEETISSSSGLRRSSRFRKSCDTKEFVVSCDTKLRDLKAMIMREFQVPTYDQRLTLEQSELMDNEKTLADLYILPGSSILLRVDEPAVDGQMGEIKTTVGPETGFKGTLLAR